MSKKLLTDAERQQRRDADRQTAREAVDALKTSEGWLRWLSLRRHFHSYSLANQVLLAFQKPDATRVAGFRAWLKLGYCVARGQRALRIWVPIPPSKAELERWKAAGSPVDEKPHTRFKLGPVFDRLQVAPLPPPAQPVALDPPIVEVTGDELAWTYPRLVTLAAELDVTVEIEDMPAQRGGYYQPARRHIGLNAAAPVNQRIKTLVHEMAHAVLDLEHSDANAELSYPEEELVVESVAYTVCGSSLGVDTAGYSIPYLASWSDGGELEVIERTAQLIDTLAKRIEDAIDTSPVEHAEAA